MNIMTGRYFLFIELLLEKLGVTSSRRAVLG